MNQPEFLPDLDTQAARWVSLLDGDAMTPADWRDLNAWLEADPAHRRSFERHQESWSHVAKQIDAFAGASPVLQPVLPAKPARFRRYLAAGTGIAACLAFVFLWLVPFYRDTATIATQPAQRTAFALADGSRADLNARTQLSTDFRHGKRLVHLTAGEAYFAVAKDPRHPFRVITPAGAIEVTGTAFNVRLAPDGRPEVTLVEGSISLTLPDPNLPPLRLTQGQQYSAGALQTLTPDQLAAATAWRDGRIVLNELTLAAAAERFAMFHQKTITVSPDIATLRLGGTYSIDNLAGFFALLEDPALGLNVVQRGPDTYTILPK